MQTISAVSVQSTRRRTAAGLDTSCEVIIAVVRDRLQQTARGSYPSFRAQSLRTQRCVWTGSGV